MKDTERLFGDAASIFEDNDYNVLNIEVVITEHDKGIEKFGPCLKTPLNTAKTLKKVGVTHCLLSNNHSLDFGKRDLWILLRHSTKPELNIRVLEKTIRIHEKILSSKNGEKVCIIAVCEHEYSYAFEDIIHLG